MHGWGSVLSCALGEATMFELAVFVSLITWAAVYYSIRAIGQQWIESAYEDSEF